MLTHPTEKEKPSNALRHQKATAATYIQLFSSSSHGTSYPIACSLSPSPAVIGFTMIPMNPGKVSTQTNSANQRNDKNRPSVLSLRSRKEVVLNGLCSSPSRPPFIWPFQEVLYRNMYAQKRKAPSEHCLRRHLGQISVHLFPAVIPRFLILPQSQWSLKTPGAGFALPFD